MCPVVQVIRKEEKMLKKLGLVLSTILLAIATLAMSTAPADAATVEVQMGASSGPPLQFVPDTVTISSGDTVKWINNKFAPHNVIFQGSSAAKLSHKQLVNKLGDSFTTTFDEPGTYSYFCQPHRSAGMMGKVIVK